MKGNKIFEAYEGNDSNDGAGLHFRLSVDSD